MRKSAVLIAVVLLVSVSCARHRPEKSVDRPGALLPPPTEHWLDEDAEKRNKLERDAWFESMHRSAPETDWRVIEEENGRAEMDRRNEIGRLLGPEAGSANWTEVGSSNLAGRTHAAVIGPDDLTLYVGSSLGGIWRGGLDGSGWEPLGDNLFGGVHDLVVLPGENGGEPDVLVVTTDGGEVHVSRDEGLTWETPPGIGDLWNVRGVGRLQDASNTILLYGRGPSTGYLPTVLASVDYGRTFSARWQGSQSWDGWMWVPRHGAGAVRNVYVAHAGQIHISSDGGFTFPDPYTIASGSDRAVLAGSENGGPVLYAALRSGGQWKLYRSDASLQNWTNVHEINDFWESLTVSIFDPNLVVYGGVELFRSNNGGDDFTKLNGWWEYYDFPETKLHADIPGIHCWPDPTQPKAEIWYINTDGGTYVSHDRVQSVQNLSLDGLAISQYYSTLSSSQDWDLISAGAQDQGYQFGSVQHVAGPGPSTPLEQLISGDYGHLSSSDGSHYLVYSTYPGFILVQDGPESPDLHSVDFPPGSLNAWLPPVVADPVDSETFYFCGDWLYRYDRTSTSAWNDSVHSSQQFGGSGVDGDYLSALAFAPTDPDRAYAVTNVGRLFRSTDRGLTWSESTDSAPPQHYFYGNAITVHPDNPLEVAVGGSGYSNAGVIRSTDGGQSWFAEDAGLPQTLVYALVYAEDGSGDLYAGTETGAWHWDRATGLWENIMANTAPVTIYWSVESVNDGGTIRYGTYGRGAWDYSIVAGDRDGDGVEDGADLCPNSDDPAQLDDDLDLLGNACDNCASIANADQADGDADYAGDLCDCSVFDDQVFAVPPEVGSLRFADVTKLRWGSVIPLSGRETEHVVYRGAIGEFPVGSSSACTATTTREAMLDDSDTPSPGSGYWSLIKGTNSCGEGSLGEWGGGSPRAEPACI